MVCYYIAEIEILDKKVGNDKAINSNCGNINPSELARFLEISTDVHTIPKPLWEVVLEK